MKHEINLVDQLNDISYLRDTGQTQTFWNGWKKKQSFQSIPRETSQLLRI